MFYMKRVPRKRLKARPKLHEITCSRCGRKDNVSFSPKGIAPVLCRRCFRLKQREDKLKRLKLRKLQKLQELKSKDGKHGQDGQNGQGQCQWPEGED